MMDKRYKITVYFAHGIRFGFNDVGEDRCAQFQEWSAWPKKAILEHDGHYLNNEMMCAMTVEEAKGESEFQGFGSLGLINSR